MKIASIFTAIAVALVGTTVSVSAEIVVDHTVTEPEVLAAQEGWCQALLNISAVNAVQGQAAAQVLAEQVIDSAYAYDMGAVLFKPTLAVKPQTFRPTKAGALSYFVAGDPNYPNDKGFALKNWTGCEIENNAILITGNTASTIGKVHFIDGNGDITSVDKTWQFIQDSAGQLRIAVHHSSLEFTD